MPLVPFQLDPHLVIDTAAKTLSYNGYNVRLPVDIQTRLSLRDKVLKSSPLGAKVTLTELDKFLPAWVFGLKKPGEEVAVPAVPYIEEKLPRDHMLTFAMYPRNSGPGDPNTFWFSVDFSNLQEMLANLFLQAHYRKLKGANWRGFTLAVGSSMPVNIYSKHMPIMGYAGRNVRKTIKQDVGKLQAEFGLGPARVMAASTCSPGFKDAFDRLSFGLMRVSAQYTSFDILRRDYLLPSDTTPRRPHILGLAVEHMLDLGDQCGTHLASLFPQWCKFIEDDTPWRPNKVSRRNWEAAAGAVPPPGLKPRPGGCAVPGCKCQKQDEPAAEPMEVTQGKPEKIVKPNLFQTFTNTTAAKWEFNPTWPPPPPPAEPFKVPPLDATKLEELAKKMKVVTQPGGSWAIYHEE
jgi:hypothetical protein